MFESKNKKVKMALVEAIKVVARDVKLQLQETYRLQKQEIENIDRSQAIWKRVQDIAHETGAGIETEWYINKEGFMSTPMLDKARREFDESQNAKLRKLEAAYGEALHAIDQRVEAIMPDLDELGHSSWADAPYRMALLVPDLKAVVEEYLVRMGVREGR